MGMSLLSDAELLSAMATQLRESSSARDAWEELYRRHRRYLYVVVMRAYGTYLGQDGVCDLVVDVLRRAFEWCGRQGGSTDVRSLFSGEDEEATRRKVRAWFGVIAERLFKDRYRRDRVTSTRDEEVYYDVGRSTTSTQASVGDPMLRAALNALSATDQAVLQISLPWYDVTASCFNVPRGVAVDLAGELGMTPAAFRQRRHRALQKLREHIETAHTSVPEVEAR